MCIERGAATRPLLSFLESLSDQRLHRSRVGSVRRLTAAGAVVIVKR